MVFLSLIFKAFSKRNFILIEKGEGNDEYAKILTRERIKRVITGERDNKEGEIQILEQAISNGFELNALIFCLVFDKISL